MDLKNYQVRALEALERFLSAARVKAPADAYADATRDSALGPYGGQYTPVEGLEAVPYCCVRLPTGGGKTLLAAHAVRVAADAYLDRPRVAVLWLVPSAQIQSQTLDALKQPRHPYARALHDAFGGAVAVYGIDERRQIRPKDFADKTVIIVATYQTFRVEDRGDRNVYSDDENLEDHFANARPGEGLGVNDSGSRKGEISFSFANVLFRQRPLLILDEAHNFMTGLSGTTKARINPAAIIEFTATPKPRSNVVAFASASELKAEDMIKMPIHLSQHGSWQQAVAHSVYTRAWLEGIATGDPDSIRPIALYQAMPATEGAEATVEVLKAHLIEAERIPENAIAVATGDQRGLDGIDLLDPACPIEHVITVAALKEGWDCSFAYVFCSLASIRSAGAVEQLLGRVLRMPFATRRASEELNRAYANVSEPSFAAAAAALKDKLTAMGFDEATARESILEAPPQMDLTGGGAGPLFSAPETVRLFVAERPNLNDWTVEARQAIRMAESTDGRVEVIIAADASEEAKREAGRMLEPLAAGSSEAVERHIAQVALARSPAARGVPFSVPRLQLAVQGELDLAEPESFIELAGWSLLDADATLPGFSFSERPEGYLFDIEGDQITEKVIADTIELELGDSSNWDAGALSRFLDRQIPHAHTGQEIFLEYCRRLVVHLIEDRRMPLAALVRGKYALKRAVMARVQALRVGAAKVGIQAMLDGIGGADASGGCRFQFGPEHHYDARNRYTGGFEWQRHYYRAVGDLKPQGDEFDCAKVIDSLPAIKHWVRNVDRTPNSYWLPTSSDRFYPDFVAELEDGRTFLIEYKGRMDEDDREKDNVGRKAEEVSGGNLLFLMAFKTDKDGRDVSAQLLKKIG